jgi:hypothetical protein
MFKRKLFAPFATMFLLVAGGAAAVTSSDISPAKVRRSLDMHLTALKSLFPNLQGDAVDHASGAAVLIVFAATDEQAKVFAEKPAAEALLGVPVRIEIIGAPVAQQ